MEALSDPRELQRCIRDLIALSTLPAIWKSYDPRQVADSAAAALISMLDADLIYVALYGERDEQIETIHTSRKNPPRGVGDVRDTLRKARLGWSERTAVMDSPFGDGPLRVAIAPIGFGDDAVLVAGSHREDFPTDTQRLLLGIAGNDMAVTLQRWQTENDERRFLALVERSADFIGLADLDGRPRYINPAGLKFVGLAGMEQASGLHILDFLAPHERKRARQEIWPIVMHKGRWTGELEFCRFGASGAMPFLVDWFRVDNPRTGQPMNIATVCRDLRAQKQGEAELRHLAETLEQRVSERTSELEDAHRKLLAEIAERERTDERLRELQLRLFHAGRLSAAGQMAATLAHELNQPLTAVNNSVAAARRLLANGKAATTGTVREVIEEASQQALRAGQIIRRLRDFVARGETDRQPESVPRMIEEARALVVVGPDAVGTKVHFRLDPDAVTVFADRVQVQQVLVNLMRNALEAMAQTKHRELKVTTALREQNMIEIAIADSGPGLPRNVAKRLFEPFVSSKRDGMGLGLSICRSIVETHGGKLWSEPNPEGGTIFRFTLAGGPMEAEDDAG